MAGISYRVLEVDLSSGKSGVTEYGKEALRRFLGGSGLAASILLDRFDSSLDPFHPQSPLVFMTGLFTGIPIPCGCRISVCARSPLGHWGEANAGGYWGPELKFTGFDGIILTGKAKEPVYLWVTGEGAEIRGAKALWGKGTFETTEQLRGQTDPQARVAAIGPAGETLSSMAGIITGGLEARVMGRSGPGAVMGAKNLKAVVVRGEQKPFIADPGILQEATKEFLPNLKYVEGLTKFGTAGVIESKEAAGILPVRNFTQFHWDKARKIGGPALVAGHLERHYGCFSCPIRCGKDVKGPEGPYAGFVGHGPEYETLSAFGSLILNDDLKSLIHLNFLCNDLGLDTMSAGITAAFAVECNQRGLLKDPGGRDLRWGNGRAVGELLEQMARREGLGTIFADGVEKASRRLGKETEAFALHSKGLEISLSNPTPTVSLALSWATSNRGACHLEGFSHQVEGGVPFPEESYAKGMDGTSGEGKGRLTARMQDYMAAFNALGLCKFLFFARLSQETICRWIQGLTGWDLSGKEVMKAGERIYNVKRVYNTLLGVDSSRDMVASRILENLRPGKPAGEGRKLFFEMRKEYYEERGWDVNGIPTREKLLSLGLEEAAEKIHRK